jgi:hypothetical protein
MKIRLSFILVLIAIFAAVVIVYVAAYLPHY